MEAVKNGAVPKITVITIIDIMTKATKRVIRKTKIVTRIAHQRKIVKKTVIAKTVTEAAKNVIAMTVIIIIIKVTNIVETVVTIKAAVHRHQVPKTRIRTKRRKKSPNLKTWRPK